MKNLAINNNRLYRNALKRELFVWKKGAISQKESIKKQENMEKIGEYNPVFSSYSNSLLGISSDNPYGWIKYLKNVIHEQNLNPCLSLGSGSGITEKKIINELNIANIEKIDIIDKSSSFSQNDLNFAELEGNKYSCILALSILHHVINLEHLLFQVNKALKPGGIFVVREYIGENKDQWADQKIMLINDALKKKYNDKYPELKLTKVKRLLNISPFEAIRSEDIPSIIDYYFKNNKIFEVKWGACSFPILMALGVVDRSGLQNLDKNQFAEIIKYSTDLDKKNLNNEKIKQCQLFGIYRKNTSNTNIKNINKWSKKKMRDELVLNLPIKRKLKFYINYYAEEYSFIFKILNLLRKIK